MARSGRNHSPRVCRPLSYEAMSLGSVRCILTQPTRQVAKRPLCESAKYSSVAFDWSSPACKAFSSVFVLHALLHLNKQKDSVEHVQVPILVPWFLLWFKKPSATAECTDFCGHALCRMLCASTLLRTARPTLWMCNSGGVSTKRQRQAKNWATAKTANTAMGSSMARYALCSVRHSGIGIGQGSIGNGGQRDQAENLLHRRELDRIPRIYSSLCVYYTYLDVYNIILILQSCWISRCTLYASYCILKYSRLLIITLTFLDC